jgi:hypothetical protein
MLTTYMFVAFLLLPGMPAQIDTREPMDSLEACQARVAEVLEAVKEHEGEQYKFLL